MHLVIWEHVTLTGLLSWDCPKAAGESPEPGWNTFPRQNAVCWRLASLIGTGHWDTGHWAALQRAALCACVLLPRMTSLFHDEIWGEYLQEQKVRIRIWGTFWHLNPVGLGIAISLSCSLGRYLKISVPVDPLTHFWTTFIYLFILKNRDRKMFLYLKMRQFL